MEYDREERINRTRFLLQDWAKWIMDAEQFPVNYGWNGPSPHPENIFSAYIDDVEGLLRAVGRATPTKEQSERAVCLAANTVWTLETSLLANRVAVPRWATAEHFAEMTRDGWPAFDAHPRELDAVMSFVRNLRPLTESVWEVYAGKAELHMDPAGERDIARNDVAGELASTALDAGTKMGLKIFSGEFAKSEAFFFPFEKVPSVAAAIASR